MSVRPREAARNPGRGGDGRRLMWSEAPIPRIGYRRVRKAGATVTGRWWSGETTGRYLDVPAYCHSGDLVLAVFGTPQDPDDGYDWGYPTGTGSGTLASRGYGFEWRYWIHDGRAQYDFGTNLPTDPFQIKMVIAFAGERIDTLVVEASGAPDPWEWEAGGSGWDWNYGLDPITGTEMGHMFQMWMCYEESGAVYVDVQNGIVGVDDVTDSPLADPFASYSPHPMPSADYGYGVAVMVKTPAERSLA